MGGITSLDVLKKYFEYRDFPTQSQFWELIDSMSVSTTGKQSEIKNYNQVLANYAITFLSTDSGSGEVILISSPQIVTGVEGQQLTLVGTSNSDFITLRNGSGLSLSTNSIQIKLNVVVTFVFSRELNLWIEKSRNSVATSGGNLDFDLLSEVSSSQPSNYIVIFDGTEIKKITKENFLSGLSTTQLAIENEGVEISSTVNRINFVGADIESSLAGNKINVYVPPPNFCSHFNTTDGVTDALIDDIPAFTRRIAAPLNEGNPFKIGDWVAGNSYKSTNENFLTYETNEDFSLVNETTEITVTVYDADNLSVLSSHWMMITGNISVTNNNILINISDYSSDQFKFKAKFRCVVDIASIIPNGGRFSIKIEHNNGVEGVFVKEQSDIFYDNQPFLAVIDNLNINENNIILKQISGVYYYDLNTSFNVNLATINYHNSNSYQMSSSIEINGEDYGLNLLSLDSTHLSNWTNIYNDINSFYTNNNWLIIQPNIFRQINAKIKARINDWSIGSWIYSSEKNILIDTYTDNSTSIFEDFRNESRRLQSDYATPWDSSHDLNSNDGLQLKNSQLIYPSEDYTSYNPFSTSQPNYLNLTGVRYFRSRFYHTNISHSNGRFQLLNHNINENNIINHNILIEISLDKTNWYIVNDLYVGGSLSNGSGCRINADVYNLNLNNQIEFTLGTGGFTDASSEWGIWYRISFDENYFAKYIGSFEIVNWI